MANLDSKIHDAKLESYNVNGNNFSIEGELMVTITLNEYRNLISEIATKKMDIDSANRDRFTRENEIKTVRAENDALKAELYTLKNEIDALREAAKGETGK